jgi:hypothetical protein
MMLTGRIALHLGIHDPHSNVPGRRPPPGPADTELSGSFTYRRAIRGASSIGNPTPTLKLLLAAESTWQPDTAHPVPRVLLKDVRRYRALLLQINDALLRSGATPANLRLLDVVDRWIEIAAGKSHYVRFTSNLKPGPKAEQAELTRAFCQGRAFIRAVCEESLRRATLARN